MEPGDLLLITLCSNATTGFQWSESARIDNQRILEQMTHRFVPPEKNNSGAAGIEEWTLMAVKEGTSIVV